MFRLDEYLATKSDFDRLYDAACALIELAKRYVGPTDSKTYIFPFQDGSKYDGTQIKIELVERTGAKSS